MNTHVLDLIEKLQKQLTEAKILLVEAQVQLDPLGDLREKVEQFLDEVT